ncbi:hypothetical protein [Pyrobaculum aerophilum]|uniref:Conserved within P. aerophilum n=2 Tax=Pyrobaculum aerophilum TaxID=13773 RepID=Q8ZXZ7_PYRAE|nr:MULTISPECIES: hypothetical protein [Pyrobaculum]AAL63199.1 conserved within P. aerophilum [Pyrobaculum aerophilum str. IM2]HII48040.1 hypothetical protein [Pyrobaculum aerophilum]
MLESLILLTYFGAELCGRECGGGRAVVAGDYDAVLNAVNCAAGGF